MKHLSNKYLYFFILPSKVTKLTNLFDGPDRGALLFGYLEGRDAMLRHVDVGADLRDRLHALVLALEHLQQQHALAVTHSARAHGQHTISCMYRQGSAALPALGTGCIHSVPGAPGPGCSHTRGSARSHRILYRHICL
jgi:hypothetical protein